MPRSDPARVLVVDDDPEIRGMVADYLGRDGYDVWRCAGGAELDAAQAARPADLVVLDVAMPGEDGLSIARRLRAAGPTPIIMLTALDDVLDRVVGLEVGADDYLTKPFDLRELRARVRAALRRAETAADTSGAVADPRHQGGLVCFGKVSLDLDGRHLVDSQGARLDLTATEFDLLAAFAQNPNRVLSRDRLLDTTGFTVDPCDRAVDIRVTRVRKKVEVDPAKPQVIRTVRSVGYIYVPPRMPA